MMSGEYNPGKQNMALIYHFLELPLSYSEAILAIMEYPFKLLLLFPAMNPRNIPPILLKCEGRYLHPARSSPHSLNRE